MMRRWLPLKSIIAIAVLASLAAFAAYGVRWINLRHDFLENPPTQYFHAVASSPTSGAPYVAAPWPLRIFGELAWYQISISFAPWEAWEDPEYREHLSPEQLQQLRRCKNLFPEAIVSTIPLDSRRTNAAENPSGGTSL